MEEWQIEELAERVALKVNAHERPCCALSEEECGSVRELLKTKRNAVKVFIYIFGAIALYALKDIYLFVAGHLSFR